jgi:hypothetical protein
VGDTKQVILFGLFQPPCGEDFLLQSGKQGINALLKGWGQNVDPFDIA